MSAHVYVIEGAPRSGKNSMRMMVNRKTGARFVKKSKAATEWLAAASAQIIEQRGRRRPIVGPVRVDAVYYQARDIADGDNLESLLWDVLKMYVIEDDSLIVAWSGEKRIDKARPRIEVTIREAA